MKFTSSLKNFIRSAILLSILVGGMVSNYASADKLKIDYAGNDILYYDPNAQCGVASQTTTANLSGNSNLEKIYNYMLGKGLTENQAAGVVGNISWESGGDPERIQGKPIGSGTKDPSTVSSGWGLIQWTPGSKVIGIAKDANITTPIYELATQIELVWWHMNNTSPTGAKNMLSTYKNTQTVDDAVETYERLMEAAGDKRYPERKAAARLALKYVKDSSAVNALALSTTNGCACSETTPSDATADVLLDPGHSGINKQGDEVDSETKLYIGDSNNSPEKEQVFSVAEKVKKTLEAKGYKVIMTKNAVDDYVNLADRAKIANKAKVQIAVSIHNTGGKFGDKAVGWVAPQKVGNYRENTDGKKITYNNGAVAARSLEYATAIKDARKKIEGDVQIHDLSFDKRAGLSPGNIPIVMLFSEVPWVYNEVGQKGFDDDKYAEGIANGIMDAVKPASSPDADPNIATSDTGSAGCGGAASGNAVKTAINYAWPTYHPAPYTTKKPSYDASVKAAVAKGLYVGGRSTSSEDAGIDCGGFITRVMQDSGVDPNYGKEGTARNTGDPNNGQWGHMGKSGLYEHRHPKTTADLQPGDIAINGDHTYMYVGKVTGFETTIASASISWNNGGPGRAPMAGKETPADGDYQWFRFIGNKG